MIGLEGIIKIIFFAAQLSPRNVLFLAILGLLAFIIYGALTIAAEGVSIFMLYLILILLILIGLLLILFILNKELKKDLD